MIKLKLQNVCVDFPIFNSSSRTITNSLVSAATGGRITADRSGHVNVRALNGINLELQSGDRLGIVGHNGSGKSTLLRVLSGIYEPTSGSIQRQGTVASLVDIGFGISPENTGKENIYLRGRLMGLTNSEIAKKLDEIIEFSLLGDFIDLPVRTYSSGMLLRLAFAVSTSITADILIMDEWLSVGDEEFAERAEQRLTNLVDNAEILVIASHSKSLIEKTSEKALWLEKGETRGLGPMQEVADQYFG
jgi:lipopolysaccharide transport system ATP-binding protein